MSGWIQAQDLGKAYKRYRHGWLRLAEWATGGLARCHSTLWALQNVTFSVEAGESVAIVGRNGAGKSTLLKLLVGTTRPSEGTFQVGGKVAALLELGLGFHPDFTGTANALTVFQMMGLPESDAKALLPEVTDFSELSEFMSQPVRTYSSGMQMRLAFAVATAQRPDVLIVDEALSVGDAYFQHKCFRRIRQFRDEGTTLLFVSHDPAAVKTLCNRALLLEEGKLIQTGSAEEVLDYYNALIAEKEKEFSIRQQQDRLSGRSTTRSGDGKVTIGKVAVTDTEGRESTSFACGEEVVVTCGLEFTEALEEYAVGILLRDRLGNEIFGTNTTYADARLPTRRAGERLEVAFRLPLNLGYGTYALSAAVHSPSGHLEANHDWIDNAALFQVLPDSGFRFAGVARLPTRVSVHEP